MYSPSSSCLNGSSHFSYFGITKVATIHGESLVSWQISLYGSLNTNICYLKKLKSYIGLEVVSAMDVDIHLYLLSTCYVVCT